MADRFEVRRVDARRIAAEMVQLESVWDQSHEQLVDHTMGAPLGPIDAHAAVALRVTTLGPRPTPGRSVLRLKRRDDLS